ncbi:TonB-dependent receptor domain-containing protein [Lepagella muris]|jgi:outer membrane receptor protein involved in Fe transport|uniref:TonB-dependent receptor n=1 Tax=Lepagella muris TaxID=3032870 RepID=A0AC61RM86_9BACT|nr:TonB-dependent receptor [Lepagella muris]TGY80652.1 TonB-dependent receptor [Lepagella muris]THG53549.1 TonB-dependent receptor [Bacteroidales bacterium]TKC55650.1 TonB-dependent receptor [Bacteroidales bacterium]
MKTSFFAIPLILSANAAFAQDVQKNDTTAGSSYDLEDLVVVADKPIVQSDGAKLTYNLQEDPSTKGNTLLDALRKVPMVSVDGEDKIRINGQENFKIYVNGKEDPSLSANYKNIFKAMPADAIVKVEVITEPGAKYDAEGTAGILNLITITKNSTDGYSGSIQATLSKAQSGGSLYGRMKKGKLTMSANFDYANGRLVPQHSDNITTLENTLSSDAGRQVNSMKQRVGFDYIGGGLNLSYDLSDRDLITVNSNIYAVKGDLLKDKSTYSSIIYNADNSIRGEVFRRIDAQIANTGITAGTSWQHDFNGNGHKTILSYLFNHGYNKLEGNLFTEKSSGVSLADPYEKMLNKDFNNEHTIQLDYENPFGDGKHKLELGGKAVWRRNNTDSYNLNGDSGSTAELTDKSDLTQIQDIYAAYASYTGKFGNLSANAGVRYEHTRMGINFHYGDTPDFLNHLNDVVPNAGLTYSFSYTSNLRLAYQMRISRPSLSQVNPFKQTFTPNQVTMGNPNLSSEKSNKVSLTYTNFGSVFGGNIGIEYSSIDNSIAHTYTMIDDVLYESYGNMGHDRRIAIFGMCNWTIIPRMQFMVNARLTRQMFSAEEMSNKGWNLNYGANWNYSLQSGFKFNLYGGQKTRSYNLTGYNDGYYYYGLGISKDFLKNDAMTVTLSANNFLQGHNTYRTVTDTKGIRTTGEYKNSNWNVGISLSWRFGSLKSDVKKTDKSINNDDKSSFGAKSGNGL